MKKQIIAAAVAASVSAVALADVAITGQMKVNYTHTDMDSSAVNDSDVFKREGDIYVKGQSGDTGVVMNFSVADHTTADSTKNGTLTVEDTYMTTKVGDVSLKVGQWDNGNNEMRASARAAGKFEASTTVAGIGVKYENVNGGDDAVSLSASMGPVAATFKQKNAGEDYTITGNFQGVDAKYAVIGSDSANSDKSYTEVKTTVAGVSVKYGKAEADSSACLNGDTWLGDYEDSSYSCSHAVQDLESKTKVWSNLNGQDITGYELATDLAGNKVTYRNVTVDGVTGGDTSHNKVIVTRPLASGATFELTYTDVQDDAETITDYNSLDLELAVKF